MIKIRKSPTADTRSCDFTKVSKEQLLNSSQLHIEDVRKGMEFLRGVMYCAGALHDADKIDDIDQFHADFLTGFKSTIWWDNHRKINRHHINVPDGIREKVNLIDVIEHIVDCVMAGKARTGTVYPLHLPPELLERAFQNTVKLLEDEVEVEDSNG